MLGLHTDYLYMKSDHSSFSQLRDIVGAHQNLNGSCDLTTPLSGSFVPHGLGLATVNLSTKFEVSNPAHYEDMKRDSKIGKCYDLGSPKVIENNAI